jgi:hypothetical protein
MYKRLHVKYPLFLSDFSQTWIFSIGFQKILKISNFIEIRPVTAALFREDGWTDMANLVVDFQNFAKLPNKTSHIRSV